MCFMSSSVPESDNRGSTESPVGPHPFGVPGLNPHQCPPVSSPTYHVGEPEYTTRARPVGTRPAGSLSTPEK